MRFHVASLPHTNTTLDYSACAYTEKVRKFCIMMKSLLGHEVYLYGGQENEAPCDKFFPCISEEERRAAVGAGHYTHASFDASLPHWRTFNNNAIAAIGANAGPRDFLCLIAGISHQPIANALSHLMAVEFGIGYSGTFAKYRVFESYAWMHAIYATQAGTAHDANGNWFDTVIPGYLERQRFPFEPHKGDYYLFIGRLVERKGFHIAAEVCKTAGKRLLIAGQGTPPDYGEYVGVVGPEERGRLMSKAAAVFVPTIYLEPFGNVAVEAMACGTPVITSDWGAFTETVIQGETGYRCRMFQDFIDALDAVRQLDPRAIRHHALTHYSLEAIAPKYDAYFRRLNTLWGKGWYARDTDKEASKPEPQLALGVC